MGRVCLVLVAGLDAALLEKTQGLRVLGNVTHRAAYEPVLPAVTSTAQATLTTGGDGGRHGIVCNGLFTHERPRIQAELDLTNHTESRTQVSFWEQSNGLLELPRFWEGMGKKTAMLFWQNSMPGRQGNMMPAADIVITPKPEHTPDGKTLTACWSAPAGLYATLVQQLGPFPLHNYWSPMAGLPSSQWIVKAAEYVWKTEGPGLQLVYIPHLDFNLQRLGPSHPAVMKDLQDVDALLAPLAEQVRAEGGTLIIMGDYGMHDVLQAIAPNLALRDAGLLQTKMDTAGKVLIDYEASAAVAMADHQIAHAYVKQERKEAALAALSKLRGVGRVLSTTEAIAAAGLANERTGDIVLLASPDAWFMHDWWRSDDEKPRWQFSVDIHNKPGYDPRELFFDPARKCIAQDASLIKGSHGLIGEPARWPVVLSDAPLPPVPMKATSVAAWLRELLR